MGFFAFGWRQVYLFWVVSILVGIFAVLNIRLEPTKDLDEYLSKPETSSQSNALFTLSLIMFLVFIGMRMMAGQMVGAFTPVYLVDEKGAWPNPLEPRLRKRFSDGSGGRASGRSLRV